MYELFAGRSAHQGENLLDLLKVKRLFLPYHIEHKFRVVFLVAIQGGGDVPRGIESSAVGFAQETRRHAVVG